MSVGTPEGPVVEVTDVDDVAVGLVVDVDEEVGLDVEDDAPPVVEGGTDVDEDDLGEDDVDEDEADGDEPGGVEDEEPPTEEDDVPSPGDEEVASARRAGPGSSTTCPATPRTAATATAVAASVAITQATMSPVLLSMSASCQPPPPAALTEG